MPDNRAMSSSLNYYAKSPVETVKIYRVNYMIKVGTDEVETLEFTTKKLDHSVSNLADVSDAYSKLFSIDLQEIICRYQAGELGTTEVPKIQVW